MWAAPVGRWVILMADYGAIPVNKFEREDEATSLDVESPVCVVSSSKANRVIVDTSPIF